MFEIIETDNIYSWSFLFPLTGIEYGSIHRLQIAGNLMNTVQQIMKCYVLIILASCVGSRKSPFLTNISIIWKVFVSVHLCLKNSYRRSKLKTTGNIANFKGLNQSDLYMWVVFGVFSVLLYWSSKEQLHPHIN